MSGCTARQNRSSQLGGDGKVDVSLEEVVLILVK